jgi:hypothetical protein
MLGYPYSRFELREEGMPWNPTLHKKGIWFTLAVVSGPFGDKT